MADSLEHTVLRGDCERVRQVLLGLVENAVKFTEQGMIILWVNVLGKADGADPFVQFTVIDTCIGISLEDRPRIFRPFQQVDDSSTRVFGGTGLGLALSKQLVERMGGEIGFKSAPSEGSRFWFSVPLDCAPVKDRPSASGVRSGV